jgi:hypothetical protein
MLSRWATAVLVLSVAACGPEETPTPAVWRAPIAARCEAQVDGHGAVDVEAEYLPAVIACENGAADFEALKAQAVAARSYLYYKLETSGRIGDGTGDQVFSCNRPPAAHHFEAVEATAGEVLTWQDAVIAAFYVAGAIPQTADCVPAPADADPTNTERYVTYNQGRRGADNRPSPLGHPASPRNRGCKSQNGAHCLAAAGRSHAQILRFYYGADISIETAVGACVVPDEPDPEPADCPAVAEAGPTTVDESDGRCFTRACETGDWWLEHPTGIADTSVSTGTIDRAQPDCTGRWALNLPRTGLYTVDVAIPQADLRLSRQAAYQVRHAGMTRTIEVDQATAQPWQTLGVFEFNAGRDQWVALPDNTGEAYREDGYRLVYDAIRIQAAPTAEPDMGEVPQPMDAGVRRDASPRDAGHADAEHADASTPPRDAGLAQASDSAVDFDATSDSDQAHDSGESALNAQPSRQVGGCVSGSDSRLPSPPSVMLLGLLLALRTGRRRR